mmetsp:Transcript_62062/g.71136  ORF Transcript_62062/g.71136 Transcript_62062/m.71136 type:complete len:179 (-) Transcript_62062:2295-2831(-)
MEVSKEVKEKALGRQKFEHEGRTIYEWDQTLDEINIYINPPPIVLPKYRADFEKQLQPGQKLPALAVEIAVGTVTVGLKGNPPFLQEALTSSVKPSESYWYIEGEELQINLQKLKKAEMWDSVFARHAKLDPLTAGEVKKQILLERFQEENPGFDFSNAEFNGQVPDARTFMGGVKYQ